MEPNTPDKNKWLIDIYLPRLILWLDKFMPSTSVGQKSVGSLCLKISGWAGFDYPVVGWWPDKGVGILYSEVCTTV